MDDLARFQRLIALVLSAMIGVAYMAFLASRPALSTWAACGTIEATTRYAGVLVLTAVLIGLVNLLVHDLLGIVIDRLAQNRSPRYEDVFVDYDEQEKLEKPVGRPMKFLGAYPVLIVAIVIEPVVGLLALGRLAARIC